MWNELTFLWNELTLLWNDLTWNDVNEMTGYHHAPSRLPMNKLTFVTENTESDTFCVEEYSEKYPIVV